MADLVPVSGGAAASGDLLGRARGALAQPGMRRMLPWFGGAAGLGLAVLAGAMLMPAPQRILYASLADGERAEVAAALDAAGIAYEIDPGTGAVTVAEDELYRARMTVAQQGALAMPESGTQLIDSLPMGASRTLEGDRLRAAQERELQMTIMEIDGVEAVRVHVAKAERSVFVRENGEPTASVMLRLARGRQLTGEQVRAIANLVAASVVGLSPDNVRIVDQNGQLLSDPADPRSDALDLQARAEAKLRDQLAQLLTPIVGAGRFSTEVQVDLDLSEQTSARESFDDEGRVRSETTSETSSAEALGAGIPGATANAPPADPEAEQRAPLGTEAGAGAARNGASNASRLYELGREVSVTSTGPGRVARVSVAVAIDEAAVSDPQELAAIEELVAAAVGADPAAGDRVEVITRAFPAQEIAAPAFWETPWFATLARIVAALLGVVLVLLLAVRPLVKALGRKAEADKGAAAGAAVAGMAGAGTASPADGTEAGPEAAAGEEADGGAATARATGEASGTPAALAQQIEAARRIVREQPEDAVQALRRMLREPPPEPAPAEAA